MTRSPPAARHAEYLDQTAKDELGATPDQLYKRALTPLRESGEIRAVKGGIDEGWRWKLTWLSLYDNGNGHLRWISQE